MTRSGKGPFESARSNIKLRAIDSQTAKLLATYEKSVPGVGSTPKSALENSGKKAAELAAEYASEEILKWWKEFKSRGTDFKVILRNVKDYNLAVLFQGEVKNIHGVTRLSERNFGGGFLEMDISYNRGKANLQRAILGKLNAVKGFEKMNIVVAPGNRIVFER